MQRSPYIYVHNGSVGHSPENPKNFSIFERFVFSRNGTVLTLLPEESYHTNMQTDDSCVYIMPKATTTCVAGAGRVPLNNHYLLGGWCSFSCQLVSPRRFAVRCGKELLQNPDGDIILIKHIRRVLQDVFEHTAEILTDPSAFETRACIMKLFPEKAKYVLLDIGWKLTSCRLENIELLKEPQS